MGQVKSSNHVKIKDFLDDSTFMIPSDFSLTTKQIEALQSEGQNVGIPFYIDDSKACRPKGKRSNIRYNECIVQIHPNTIQLSLCPNTISINFTYDAYVPGAVMIFINALDETNSKKIKFSSVCKALGPFQLQCGENMVFNSSLLSVYIDKNNFAFSTSLEHPLDKNQYDIIVAVYPIEQSAAKIIYKGNTPNSNYFDFSLPMSLSSSSPSSPRFESPRSIAFSSSNKDTLTDIKSSKSITINNKCILPTIVTVKYYENSTKEQKDFEFETIKINKNSIDVNEKNINESKQSVKQNINTSIISKSILSSISFSSQTKIIKPLTRSLKSSKTSKVYDINSPVDGSCELASPRNIELFDKATSPKKPFPLTNNNNDDLSYVMLEVTYARITPSDAETLFSTKYKTQNDSNEDVSSVIIKPLLQRVQVSRSECVYTINSIFGLNLKKHNSNVYFNTIKPSDESNNFANTTVTDNNDSLNIENNNLLYQSINHLNNNYSSSILVNNPDFGLVLESVHETDFNQNTINNAHSHDISETEDKSNITLNQNDISNIELNGINNPTSSTPNLENINNADNNNNNNNNNSVSDESESSNNECVICLTDPKSIIMFPCRHLCTCIECSETLPSHKNKCPICRTDVQCMIQIPLSIYNMKNKRSVAE